MRALGGFQFLQLDLGRRAKAFDQGLLLVVVHRHAAKHQHAFLGQGLLDRVHLRAGQRLAQVDVADLRSEGMA